MTTNEIPAKTPVEEHGRPRMSRRKALGIFAGAAAGIVTVSAGAGGFFIINKDRGDVSHAPQPGGQGGQASAETLPAEDTLFIDDTNPDHFYEIFLKDPGLRGSVEDFLGTTTLNYITGRQSDGQYPWLQIDTNKGEHLTLALRATGETKDTTEPIPTWADIQKQPTFKKERWSKLAGVDNTVVSFNDLYRRGLTMAGVTGWTNTGSADERMFSVQSEHVEQLGSMSPDARRAAFISLTGALFEARALG